MNSPRSTGLSIDTQNLDNPKLEGEGNGKTVYSLNSPNV